VLFDNVSIQQNIHLTCAAYIHIGKNTTIAANVTITDIFDFCVIVGALSRIVKRYSFEKRIMFKKR
jgi:acetyltransferase-like isoleucine patch superfamily enzyme